MKLNRKEFFLSNNRVKPPQLPRPTPTTYPGELGRDLYLASFERWRDEMFHRQDVHLFGAGKWFAGTLADLAIGQITSGDPRIFIPIMLLGLAGSAVHLRGFFQTRNQIQRAYETL